MFPRIAREPRLSDKVADLLLRTITAHELNPGERLPSERELSEQFGVSRTVIREAVRALATKGIVEVRSGSGVRVAAVDAAASESMRLYLRGRGRFDYRGVHEVRTMIEVQIAGLAAARSTTADIVHLTRICEKMAQPTDDVETMSRRDVDFHRAIAEATHNPLYLIMLDSIGDIMLEIRRATIGLPGRVMEALDAHRLILARIRAHDTLGAGEAMREHLEDTWSVWQQLQHVHVSSGASR